MGIAVNYIHIFLNVYLLCMFIWALMSWLPMISPSLAYNSTVIAIRNFLDSIILPYVRLFRAIPPLRMGAMMMDVSFIVAFLVLYVVDRIVLSLAPA